MNRTLLLAAFLACATAVADGRVDVPIVVTQVPREGRPEAASAPHDLLGSDWFEGARVVIISPEQKIRVLSEGFVSACDPNVSFDAKTLLFAGKRSRADRWRIYEAGFDGGKPRPVSPADQEARHPIYASTLFTLDSPEPWFTIFYSAREPWHNEAGQPFAASLYNVKLDGTELRRITFNPNHNLDPFQMWDGRVIYAAERHPNQPGGPGGRVGLYAIHVEGADMEFFGGGPGRRIQRMPCATPGGRVVFIESDDPARDGGGRLACVEERRPHVTYRPLATDEGHVFRSPSPWRENQVLVSRRSADGSGTWGVFCVDADQGRCEPVFDSPDFHDVQAVAVTPRDRPDGHSTVVDTRFDAGIFYGLNCYVADPRMTPHLPAGTVKRVRLIEGVPQSTTTPGAGGAGHGPFVPRRLVGEAPVEADGSFNVEVPADTPLLLQTLDERGLALATCGWIWVKPKEKRGCIGCHEDPERIPENEYVLALRRPSNRLLLPPAQRRTLSFRQDIVPMLERHCATADCHGGKDTPLHLPLSAEPTERDARAAYTLLMVPVEGNAGDWFPQPGRYVEPGRARTSWLVWQLMGTNTARPWDQRDAPMTHRKVKPMPPQNQGTPLRAEELRTLVQWIDLGAQYETVKAVESGAGKLAETK